MTGATETSGAVGGRAVQLLCQAIARPDCRTLAVIGLAKNAGKTTVVNALLAGCSVTFGLTSLGLDGEPTDHLTGLAKPRIRPPAGTLIATTRGSLERSCYTMEVLEELPWATPLGPVVIGRAGASGAVEVSGPTTLAELRQTILRLLAHGAHQVLVDGAIDRMGSASPDVSDGLILATGGVLGDTLESVVEATVASLDVLATPATDEPTRALLAPWSAQGARAVCLTSCGATTALDLDTAIGEGATIAHESTRIGADAVFVGGAVTREFLDDLVRVLPPLRRLRLVVRDASVLVLPATAVARARRAIQLEVLAQLRVLAVTVNPFRLPRPYRPESLFDAIVDAVGARTPVVDVVHGLVSRPSVRPARDHVTPWERG